MIYIAVFLVVVAALAISTAYYLYEMYASLRILANRAEWLTHELASVRNTVNIAVRGRELRQNETPRPARKTTPPTINNRRKGNGQ
jgi:hypothetical protein